MADGAALFSVKGRSTHSLNAEFVGDFPGTLPEARAYTVTLEALTSKADQWLRLITWKLQAGNLKHPGNNIMYTNDPDYLTAEEQAEVADNLAALRSKLPRATSE